VVEKSKREDAAETIRRINRAWRGGQVEDLAPMVLAEIVMVFLVLPGGYRDGKSFLPASGISARTREFMNSVSRIMNSMSRATWLWPPFDMRWSILQFINHREFRNMSNSAQSRCRLATYDSAKKRRREVPSHAPKALPLSALREP
jgi:hypothetical protein